MSGQEMCGFTRKLLFMPMAAGPLGPPDLQLEVLESRLEAPSASLALTEGSPGGSPPFLCHSHCHLLVLFFQPLLRCGWTGEEALFWWW